MTSARAREAFELEKEPDKVRDSYGRNRFGQSCLLARRLIEAGVRYVTVNMFETVFDEITWDIHGSRPFSPISCYRDLVGPMFDHAFSSLIDDLAQRGLLQNTLVMATGRVRAHPQGEPRRRKRPLARAAGPGSSRAAGFAEDRSLVRPMPSAGFRRIVQSARLKWPRLSTT